MFEEDIATMGLRVLSCGEQGARELSNNIRPVRTPADMKDIKFRVVGSPLFLDIFKELGANPMSISWAEALTALQQGTVDGQENPLSIITANDFYEVQKYLSLSGHFYSTALFIVNPDFWNSAEMKSALTSTLGFLSDDNYEFTFVKLAQDHSIQDYLEFNDAQAIYGKPELVVMFSGGLDSLAGAIDEVLSQQRRVVLVTHKATPKLNTRH